MNLQVSINVFFRFIRNNIISNPGWSIHKILLLFSIVMTSFLNSAGTAFCSWKAGYFDASYISWYGHGNDNEKQRIIKGIISRTWIIIKIDSLVRYYKHTGKISSFPRWELIDNIHAQYRLVGEVKPINIKEKKAYLNLADSIAANKALALLWGIDFCRVSMEKPGGIWLYSLHYKAYKSRVMAQQMPDTLTQEYYFDKVPLWLSVEYDEGYPNTWYQHEIDGYYHRYFGLFLTLKDVRTAQEWFLKNLGLKTTITSHFLTESLLMKYISF